MKKSILFITCEEAHHICDKNQYGEATLWERFKLTIRLSWCRITRAYTKRNKKLTRIIEDANIDYLSPNEKNELESKFQQELSNHK